MPRLSVASKAQRRADILATALACFARSGYHATTMAEVAEAAEVSKGTPYLYFPSKEALYLELHEEWNCGLADRIGTEVSALSNEERSSPRRVLLTVARAVGAHAVEHVDTCRVLMEAQMLAAYQPQIAAALEAAERQSQRQLRDLFRAGVEAGEWPTDTDPTLAALMFTSGLYGLMARWHLRPGSFSWEAAATWLVGVGSSRGQGRGGSEQAMGPEAASGVADATAQARRLT
ncbi:MAG: TetR/AcrR family transcriptional regulator [Candidatus Dormibacteria bacterium]